MHRARHLLIVLLTVLIGAALLPAAPAQAAGYGPGFDLGLGRIGAYVTPLGTQAYCLEIAKNRPLGWTDSGTVGGWGGLSPDALAQLNWVLHRYGQSPDPVVTAAVNLYVWSVGDPGTYGSHGMSGDDYYSGRAGDARGAVLAVLAEIRGAAAAVPPAGTVDVELDPDLHGRVTVSDPAGRGGTLTIEGADQEAPVPVEDGSVIEFVAQPQPGERTAVVTATATFAAVTYPGAITVHDSGPDQHLAGPAGEPSTATDRAEVPLEFHPQLESAVEDAVLATGSGAVDRLEFSLAEDSPAPWLAGHVVHVRGTLYGPLPTAPIEAETAPEGAPVAWTEVIEVDAEGAFTSSGDFAPTATGHYTWVWSIDAAEQPEGSVLPVDYVWSDRFGIPAESFELVAPLPSTGAEDEPSWWLGAAGALLLGGGLVGIAAVVRVRVRRAETQAKS